MKKALFIITFMASFLTASAQHGVDNYISIHSIHYGDGYMTVRRVGDDIHVTDHDGGSSLYGYDLFETSDQNGNRYDIYIPAQDFYCKLHEVSAPKVGTEYLMARHELAMNEERGIMEDVYTVYGKLVVEETPNGGSKGRMAMYLNDKVSVTNTYIVFQEYTEYFKDKYVRKIGERKLKRKYGTSFKNDVNCTDVLTIIVK